ncbi:MAG: uL13 family ribosomal protein, partial [Thermodesulfobacteriota bacterium]
MKTYQAKKEELDRKWYLVNAEGKVLGRLSTELVKVLKGKNKPTYTPHMDTGDFVVVVNAG